MLELCLSTESRENPVNMAEKKLPDLRTFIESVNKKNTNHSGKKVRFDFVKKKRK